ncbi:MAG TPA: nucleoside-diphosphate sugar epimerase/dehydratase [Alphaproteobacteria bacterium]|nr:nucleoside-diphosphate sugar epimerase/dehydratase [Alphaproteobacteria bacterium]
MSPWRLTFNRRIATVALHDVVMAALSFELAVMIRYITYGAPQGFGFLWEGTLIFTAVCALTFWRIGLYRGIWYYASLNDLIAIVKAVTLGILIFLPVMFVITRLENFPRTALFINWPLLVLMLSGPRFLYRALKDGNLGAAFERSDPNLVPVLLVGAGDEAEAFIREIGRSRHAGYRVVGIVDDRPGRQGRDIRGIRVMGSIADAGAVIDDLARRGRRPQRLIVTSERFAGTAMAELLDLAERRGMTLARAPRITDLRSGKLGEQPLDLRPVAVEDLLGRPQKVLDREAMQELVAGRRVLVTGAGGTIGSELARQMAALGPARLALLDNGEHALYTVDLELGERFPELARSAVLGDVRDPGRLTAVFDRERPELVFHAAAFKHVPLNEQNPNEAVLTNALGTKAVAEACLEHGAAVMVLISTDKAVEPSSVMGASKRLAELTCQALADGSGPTRFVIVRFGNVLGSTGSVVPLFERQLARGGPLTVTDPEITRYFMTTREAVELVLQASAIPADQGNQTGGIFVLDMGEPVRIQDLARQMIRLAGYRPDKDVAITYTGLRPGEKLHERLFRDQEELVETRYEGILLTTPPAPERAALETALEALATAARARNTEDTLARLAALVPDYRRPQ